jgi:hypothetical protein
VSPRIAVRATGLVLVGVAFVVGLTIYFSTEKIPPCLVTGAAKWRPPADNQTHRFEVVVPDRALCFFDIDSHQQLVGYVKLPRIQGVTAIAPRPDGQLALRYGNGLGALVDVASGRVRYGVKPPPSSSDDVHVRDPEAGLEYSTQRGELGFRVLDLTRHKLRARMTFPGFTWNPRFGPNPPDHGLSLAPDRPELWVLDAPNSAVHLYDVSGASPKHITDIRLTKPISGDENPCATQRCGRIGWLQHSSDGRYVYVGDSGDVIDTQKREEIANLEALHQSRLMVEVDWSNGRPFFATTR